MKDTVDLVLVHGLLGSLSFFEPEKYLPNINVIRPDLFGYGNSPLKEDLSLQDQVDFVKRCIEENTNGPCWLLGHSVGGAISNIFASQYPELVKGIINVEGNFTIKDAFWCQSISEKDFKDWEVEYKQIRKDPEKWLTDSEVALTSQRIEWSKEILSYQDAETVQAVAKAVVKDTSTQKYQLIVEQVSESDIPTHLVAGEHSLQGWNIPGYVRESAELHVIPQTGHMMMLEKPEAFCRLVEQIITG